jgi:putative ABC transport system permease protein
MGATIRDIYLLISKEILVLVTISGIIALPVIYFIARNWLQNYYYRISPGAVDFLAGFAIAIVIAVLTVSYRTIRSARANPVDSLRYE